MCCTLNNQTSDEENTEIWGRWQKAVCWGNPTRGTHLEKSPEITTYRNDPIQLILRSNTYICCAVDPQRRSHCLPQPRSPLYQPNVEQCYQRRRENREHICTGWKEATAGGAVCLPRLMATPWIISIEFAGSNMRMDKADATKSQGRRSNLSGGMTQRNH